MENKKLWHALQHDTQDAWDYGTFDRDEALELMANNDDINLIAVIDANYDEDGNATTDGICVDEIYKTKYSVGAYVANGNIQIIDSDLTLEAAEKDVEYYEDLDKQNGKETEYVILGQNGDENLWHKTIG